MFYTCTNNILKLNKYFVITICQYTQVARFDKFQDFTNLVAFRTSVVHIYLLYESKFSSHTV